MRLHSCSIILWLLVLVATASTSLAADAEYIWAENDTVGSTLYISQYQDEVWGEKEAIVSNENFNVLPALGSDAFGNHLAVWVIMQNDGSSSLEYSFKRQEKWSNPQVLSCSFTENLAPVILFDTFNIPWVFWSANKGDNDDIYMTSFSGGTWNQIKKVNNDNRVPDILPKAWLDESGDIVVSWEQLQPDMTYLEVSRKIIDDLSIHSSRFSGIYRKNKTKGVPGQAELISPPPFKINSRATLHFPGKKMLQSSTIRKRIDR